MSISIKSLSYKYKKSLPFVFNNLNLEIKEGTVNVLLGLNGCGKTTLLKNIAGLLTKTFGTIEVDSVDLSSLSIAERSKQIAYVCQYSSFNDEYSVEDYLSFGIVNSLKLYEVPGRKHFQNIHKCAEKLHISHLLDKYVNELSGGERQIVEIASSILQYTKYILLDEPTSALDLKNQSVVLNLLKDLVEDGKTILLTTHNPNHALKLNANTILMNNGEIVKVGNAKDIIKPEILKAVYGDQICYSKDLDYEEVTFK